MDGPSMCEANEGWDQWCHKERPSSERPITVLGLQSLTFRSSIYSSHFFLTTSHSPSSRTGAPSLASRLSVRSARARSLTHSPVASRLLPSPSLSVAQARR
ncbi:hypothetical protein PanWU01x14_049100 [Parasponia andersonii]|uniref:Uncharacterized protein n=1 Tax=Parasponia andersonii TaxID=3476 RepID=A0A2P5DMI3_PARAD|nr:hypothetical protein PanWU01x14_049100 [Parasponia andersonii]